jgi:hypothetical protein
MSGVISSTEIQPLNIGYLHKGSINWVVAHPLQIAPEQWGMNAETDVSLSAEGAVCKNLPASAMESVNPTILAVRHIAHW